MDAAMGAKSSTDEEQAVPQAVASNMAEIGANTDRHDESGSHLSSQITDAAMSADSDLESSKDEEEAVASNMAEIGANSNKHDEPRSHLSSLTTDAAMIADSDSESSTDEEEMRPCDHMFGSAPFWPCGMQHAKNQHSSSAPEAPGWTPNDQTQLTNALLEHSRNIKEKELKSKVAALYGEHNNDNSKQIALIEEELSELPKQTLLDIALPLGLDQDYDWEEMSCSLNGKHTAQECKDIWRTILHPSINKTPWEETEYEQLKKLAIEFNEQNWDIIAKKLNTGRSGYQCFVYYRAKKSAPYF